MPQHFSQEEFAKRKQQALTMMKERALDGLLLFKPESQYYLTGYDSTGFIVFQCMYFGVNGKITLLTRAPDVRQAAYTAPDLTDVRVWVDREGSNPGQDLREILEEHNCKGQRLGVEYESFGLNAYRGKQVEAALEGFCTLVDASDLVSKLRLIKSEAELVYIRKAAELADNALEEAKRLAKPGTFEGDIYAAMHGAIFKGGGFYPASRFPVNSGKKALLVRTTSDLNTIGNDDQVQLEFGGTYRHYHACLMRTILTGKVRPQHQAMYDACATALQEVKAVCKPGNTLGNVFDTYAKVFDDAGFQKQRVNSCGYSLGATYAPSWMDHPLIFTGNPTVLQPNMVYFLLMFLLDSETGLAMSLGETIVITERGCEALSKASHDLVVN
ncbi:MAG: M24 family metallopeptidase [Trueperaceae bacterium]